MMTITIATDGSAADCTARSRSRRRRGINLFRQGSSPQERCRGRTLAMIIVALFDGRLRRKRRLGQDLLRLLLLLLLLLFVLTLHVLFSQSQYPLVKSGFLSQVPEIDR